MFSLMTADKLPNGANIIYKDTLHRIVMCQYGNEYVTWHIDDEGYGFWGHYFSDIYDAMRDYEDRVADMRGMGYVKP